MEGRVQPSPISASPLRPLPWSSGAQGRETHLNVRCRQSDSGRECHCQQRIRVQPSAAQIACVWGTRRIPRWASGLQAPSRLLHPAPEPCDLRTLLAVIGPNEAWAELERGEEVGEEADQFQTNYQAAFSSCPGLGGLPTCDGGPGLSMMKARWHVNPHQPVLDSQVLPSRPHTPAPPPHKDPLPQAPVIYTSHLHQRGAPCSQRPTCRVSGGLSRSPGSARGLGSAALALRSLGASPLLELPIQYLGSWRHLSTLGGNAPPRFLPIPPSHSLSLSKFLTGIPPSPPPPPGERHTATGILSGLMTGLPHFSLAPSVQKFFSQTQTPSCHFPAVSLPWALESSPHSVSLLSWTTFPPLPSAAWALSPRRSATPEYGPTNLPLGCSFCLERDQPSAILRSGPFLIPQGLAQIAPLGAPEGWRPGQPPLSPSLAFREHSNPMASS